jgi:DNA-directed RNA polymerase subunit beta
MSRSIARISRIRKSFGRIEEKASIPNLIYLQKKSYDDFLYGHTADGKQEESGLTGVFKSVFPIGDYTGRAQLEFVKYALGTPKYDVAECLQRDATYAAPLRATFRLIIWDVDKDTGSKTIKDIKEQEVYMGEMPLMTEKGAFVFNGTERVVVSQMHRSPGVFFDHDFGKTHASGKYLFSCRVIPYRGSWIDFEFDPKDILYVRIDRRRKVLATTFLLALDDADTARRREEARKKGEEFDISTASGLSREALLNHFYKTRTYTRKKNVWSTSFDPEEWKGIRLTHDLINADSGETVLEKGAKITARIAKKMQEEGLINFMVSSEDLLGHFIARDFVNPETGEILATSGDEITEELFEIFESHKLKSIETLAIDSSHMGPYLRNTLVADRNTNKAEALIDIYKVLRPGEPALLETADEIFQGLFFDEAKYDLSAVGRAKLNDRLDIDASVTTHCLTRDDIFCITKTLLDLKDGRGEVDDIDHLSNRRVRSVGELLANQYRAGLIRIERVIRERMSSLEVDTLVPNDIINAKPAAASVREFFGSSQLSQFMDQTNPLSEITHKRRLSALGPGGLTRDRAGFEVRDVHFTHYGRICPIETPEGPNIGLINSLSTFARINDFGFIETPYLRVVDGKITEEIIYLTASQEEKHTIAQATAPITGNSSFADAFVLCRKRGDYINAPASEVTLMDISPKQIVSVAASLIPFLENDDANRALMGSNMQRQALPLLKCEAPLVGTGMEAMVALDSGAVVKARRAGVVDQVNARRIVIRATEDTNVSDTNVDIYNLQKFQRSNHNTCINQKPLVRVGDVVGAGQVLADGAATELGELALGRNVLVTFMSWHGYTFEDSIIISENISRNDVYTSVHIEEYEVVARDTKLGNEEITRDIPNVGDESLKHLDDSGIISIGAEVKPGDILVGRVTPKGESPVTPEEKLLRAIFGEKASDVRDSSLRVPPGVAGTVVDVRIFSRRGVDKDDRAIEIENAEIDDLKKERDAERDILDRSFSDRLRDLLVGHKVVKSSKAGVPIDKGTIVSIELLNSIPRAQWRQIVVDNEGVMHDIDLMRSHHEEVIEALQKRYEEKIEKLKLGEELAPGVLKMVKVFLAVKRKLQPGDKMAGRHGNKGVVSKVVPLEDMPFLEDGTPVDIILNPLGLPSRMNVGQILETHLGFAAMGLGKQIDRALKDYKAQAIKAGDVREQLKGIYEKDEYVKTFEAMSDSEIIEMSQNLRKGVPIATPVFDGAKEADIDAMLTKANIPTHGQMHLIDGKTGEPFERLSTVGCMYMLKLHHLVDEKIHARSIGPYSLVTQQPLGGKAQFGGQRFGEMEVWALQAYGAAHTLQEMLTIKSDDVAGRTKIYESIIRGDDNFVAGVPESFNVLVKELQSLGLDMDFGRKEKATTEGDQ